MRIPFLNRFFNRIATQDELSIETVSGTDVGLKRQRNEDNFFCLSTEESPAGLQAVMMVADGMGGHADGDIASQMAVETIKNSIAENDSWKETDKHSLLRTLTDIVEDANTKIYQEGLTRKQSSQMGTTCTLAVVRSGMVFIAHIGDSRAYLHRNSELSQLTTDHTWVQQQVLEGHISPEQADTHPRRNIITQAMGITQEIDVENVTTNLQNKDILLICSDGLHGLIKDHEISSLLNDSPIEQSKDTLISRAKEAGGDDNITLVLGLMFK